MPQTRVPSPVPLMGVHDERCGPCADAGFPDILAHYRGEPASTSRTGKAVPPMCHAHAHGLVAQHLKKIEQERALAKVRDETAASQGPRALARRLAEDGLSRDDIDGALKHQGYKLPTRQVALAEITPQEEVRMAGKKKAKSNGRRAAEARLCQCGCKQEVPAGNRFSYIAGHMKRKRSKSDRSAARGEPACSSCGKRIHKDNELGVCMRCRGKKSKKGPQAMPARRRRQDRELPAPVSVPVVPARPVAAIEDPRRAIAASPDRRCTIAVTEAQLNKFLTGLPFEDKQYLANHYLATEVDVA